MYGEFSLSSSASQTTRDAAAPVLALRPREAAAALGIGERLLWSKTNAGDIPHLRIGKAVVYPVEALNRWLVEQVEEGGRQ